MCHGTISKLQNKSNSLCTCTCHTKYASSTNSEKQIKSNFPSVNCNSPTVISCQDNLLYSNSVIQKHVPVDVFVSDLRQNILTSEFLTTVKIPIFFWVVTPFELAVDIKISEKHSLHLRAI
jgi:hypothetical protein